ncbi:mechanosensitive ion channel family protein [Deinococcus knuensis]|uniref:mechanosensitive ion channel family protein n=1 Tax=Deinococcus knuensis TaxID=1837380 RepID=UPI001E4BFD8A|nr:mechanosensitive ion channel family protein [Deinococcus knuensis]
MTGSGTPPDLLGTGTVFGILRGAWRDAGLFLHEWGPELTLSAALIGAYFLLYLGAWQLSRALIRRLVPGDLRPVVLRAVRIGLRLTFLMLALLSSTALFGPLREYGPAIFRVYLLLLSLLVGWHFIQRFLQVQAGRWALDSSLTLLLMGVTRGVWAILGLYLVFGQFGINLLPILGGLGVVGLAVGFAAQDILANLISGVTLLLDRPFRIGDWVRTDRYEGQVTGLTLRTTRLRTRDNEHVSIPNKDVAGNVIVNLTQGGRLRLNVPVSIEYGASVEQARRVLLPVMLAHPKVLHSPAPVVLVRELAASSVDVILRCWVTEEDVPRYPVIMMQLTEAAKEALQDAGMEIPFPHLQLHIDGARGLDGALNRALRQAAPGSPPERDA